MALVQGLEDRDDLARRLARAVDDLGVTGPPRPVEVDAREPQIAAELLAARLLLHPSRLVGLPTHGVGWAREHRRPLRTGHPELRRADRAGPTGREGVLRPAVRLGVRGRR